MSRRPIQFDHSESKAIWKLLERAANKSHRDRQRVFRDWITMITCVLSAKQMEDLYLEVVKQYGDPLTSADQKRDRAVDALHEAFHLLVESMDEASNEGIYRDFLGDIFQGAITYGEAGQFFTPESVVRMMSEMTAFDLKPGMRVNDPACGSGRTLLEAGRKQPRAVFYGEDIDSRCVMMTAINLGLYGLRGVVRHRNTISMETWATYVVGMGDDMALIRRAEDMKPANRPASVLGEQREPVVSAGVPAAACVQLEMF